MSQQANIEALKAFGEAVNTGRYDAFSDLVSDAVVDHDPAPGQGPGPQGYADFFKTMKSAFPDMKITVEHLAADEDNVSFAYTLTGTQNGEFQGVPASGKPIKVRGMQISRFEDGKMVERWGATDELGILKQLGAAPV